MFRAIVFDFDGVILDSVAIKGRAFRGLFPEHPEHAARFERFHHENAGLSRHLKIAWFYRELLGHTASEQEIERAASRFGEIVAGEMRTCPFVAGATHFLDAHAGAVPMFVASGTPEAELRELVAARGLRRYFDGVFGAPAAKSEILAGIARRFDVAPAHLLFVGDGKQDAEAAREVGVRFVGRVAAGEPDRLGDVPIALVRDLFELDRRLPDLVRAVLA